MFTFERWALVKLLNLLTGFSLLVAVVSYCRGAPARRRAQADAVKAKHYQAWQVINTAQGKGGDGGRADALEELLADGVELDGVNIAHARLRGISLPGAILSGAQADSCDLVSADLRGTRLSGASLNGANLAWADLRGANLAGAALVGANLEGALLDLADFSQADLRGASFEGASARDANFGGADLRRAKLVNAVWDSATFSNADLRRAAITSDSTFDRAIMDGANVAGIGGTRLAADTASNGVVARFARRGTVWMPVDSAWTTYHGLMGDAIRVSRRHLDWSVRRQKILDWDAVFPRKTQEPEGRSEQ